MAYKRTLKVNPFYVFGTISLARLYVFSGQSEKAIDVLQNTLKWYRGDHEMSLFMGLAYAFNKDAKRAVEELENSLKSDPDYPLAYGRHSGHSHGSNERVCALVKSVFLG